MDRGCVCQVVASPCMHGQSLQLESVTPRTLASVRSILQARILERVAVPARNLPGPGVEAVFPASPALQVHSSLLRERGSPVSHHCCPNSLKEEEGWRLDSQGHRKFLLW